MKFFIFKNKICHIFKNCHIRKVHPPPDGGFKQVLHIIVPISGNFQKRFRQFPETVSTNFQKHFPRIFQMAAKEGTKTKRKPERYQNFLRKTVCNSVKVSFET